MKISKKLKQALLNVIDEIYYDAESIGATKPDDLIELAIDADRLYMRGYTNEQDELNKLYDKYGCDKVIKELVKKLF